MSLIESLTRIKNAVYGREVREALHDGVFRANQIADKTQIRQDAVENFNTQVIQEMTDKDVISAPEIIAARGGKPTLGARLDVTSGLIGNVQDFGAKGDGVTNDTQYFNTAFSSQKNISIPEKESYMLYKFQGVTGQQVSGIGKPKIKLMYNAALSGSPVLAGLGSDSIYENLHFESVAENLEWSRVDLENKANVKLVNCSVVGFTHGTNHTDSNSWGLYLKNSKDVTIENCYFEDNTQADIAILGGSKNIRIENSRGPKLHLNFEPNMNEDLIENVIVSGGEYDRVSLIQPLQTKEAIKKIVFENVTIHTLYYNGGDVEFINCKINSIVSGEFSGVVKLNDTIAIGPDLIKDTKLVSFPNATAEWMLAYTDSSNMAEKATIGSLKYLSLNPQKKSAIMRAKTKKITVVEQGIYMIDATMRGDYSLGAAFIGQHIVVNFFGSGDTLLGTKLIRTNFVSAGNKSEFKKYTGFFTPPLGTLMVEVHLQSAPSPSLSKVDFEEVRVRRVLHESVKSDDLKSYSSAPPTVMAGNSLQVSLKGDVLYNANVESGSHIGWVCTASGNPGTWKGFGLIE